MKERKYPDHVLEEMAFYGIDLLDNSPGFKERLLTYRTWEKALAKFSVRSGKPLDIRTSERVMARMCRIQNARGERLSSSRIVDSHTGKPRAGFWNDCLNRNDFLSDDECLAYHQGNLQSEEIISF